jgi:arylsulfatase A-like enzyme
MLKKVLTLGCLVLCAISSSAVSATGTQPNIVVVLTDDQGWGDLSVNGNANLSTPNIDRLSEQGASFDRFYVCPVCSPTRAEFLTGRYHPRGGVFSTSAGGERMDLDEQTIGEVFKASDYGTGMFGKWHNGMQHPYHPNSRGFDEFYGFCSGHWGHYFNPLLEHNGEIVRGEGFIIDDLTTKAMDFMEFQVKVGKPFLAYLAYNTPHSPMQVPEKFWKKFDDLDLAMKNRDPEKENLQHSRAALAMCENIDWNIGRLTGKLDDLGIAENTIFIYFADNGPNGVRWNGGMKGRKGSTDEGGVRSPLFVKWPAKIQAGKQVRSISSVTDLLPTLADMAGIKYTPAKPLDGLSMKSAILDDFSPAPDRMIFSYWNKKVSVRTQRFRLDNTGELYDIIADPEQRSPVSDRHPKITKTLRDAVSEWEADVVSQLHEQERPFVICHPDAPMTQLPARDGIEHGTIKRSNRFPNSSYFLNWTDEGDSITWDVQVAIAGKYEVTLFYACPAKDVGSSIELRMGNSVLRAKITEAHDPPIIGAAEDKVVRQESYEKDFKPIKIGSIMLEKGDGVISLTAPEIPGNQALEFRLLLLRPVHL